MKTAIEKLVARENLSAHEMEDAVRLMMQGEADPAAVAAFLTALAIKGETVEEIAAAARVMRDLSKKTALMEGEIVVDPVGTGGDGARLFNVSTASAVIAAAAGVKIAKHGNIAASSASGSADVLRQAGVVLELSPAAVAESVSRCGFGFMFAQAFHTAMRHVAPVRRAIGIRTVFNVLGPLCNPAGVRHQVLGVFSRDMLRPMVEVAKALGSRRIIAVHSADGLDEFSIGAPNYLCELREDGHIDESILDPAVLGLHYPDYSELQVVDSGESLALIREIFAGAGPAAGRDMLALNSAAIFRVAGKSASWEEGVALAEEMIDSGRAAAQLEKIAAVSQELAGECS